MDRQDKSTRITVEETSNSNNMPIANNSPVQTMPNQPSRVMSIATVLNNNPTPTLLPPRINTPFQPLPDLRHFNPELNSRSFPGYAIPTSVANSSRVRQMPKRPGDRPRKIKGPGTETIRSILQSPVQRPTAPRSRLERREIASTSMQNFRAMSSYSKQKIQTQMSLPVTGSVQLTRSNVTTQLNRNSCNIDRSARRVANSTSIFIPPTESRMTTPFILPQPIVNPTRKNTGSGANLPSSSNQPSGHERHSIEYPPYLDLISFLVSVNSGLSGNLCYSPVFEKLQKMLFQPHVSQNLKETVEKLKEESIHASRRLMNIPKKQLQTAIQKQLPDWHVCGLNFYHQFFDMLSCIIHFYDDPNVETINTPHKVIKGDFVLTEDVRKYYFEAERNRLRSYRNFLEEIVAINEPTSPEGARQLSVIFHIIHHVLRRMGPPMRPVQYSHRCSCVNDNFTTNITESLPEQTEFNFKPSGLPVIDLPHTIFQRARKHPIEESEIESFHRNHVTYTRATNPDRDNLIKLVYSRCLAAAQRELQTFEYDMVLISVSYDYFDAVLEHFDCTKKRYFDKQKTTTARHIFHHTDKVFELITSLEVKRINEQDRKWKLSPLIVQEIECVFRHLYRINLKNYFKRQNGNWDKISHARYSPFTTLIRQCWSRSFSDRVDSENLEILSVLCAILFNEGCHALYKFDEGNASGGRHQLSIGCEDCTFFKSL